MRKRKFLVMEILVAAIGIVLIWNVLTIWGCGEKRNLNLEKIACDKHKKNPVVYIKEKNKYVPYLVLAPDYHGNILLLRKNVLSEEMQYKQHVEGWMRNEYGSYYEESSIDEFLNTEFLELFSQDVKAAIVNTTIEVTNKECYDQGNCATHMIERKVFLLSAVELGVEFGVGYAMAKEGQPLKYFEDVEYSVKTAYKADGTAWPYWTRTPWLCETYLVTVAGVTKLGDAPADRYLGVRPAFCMGKDTIVWESDCIIVGENVYIIE